LGAGVASVEHLGRLEVAQNMVYILYCRN
jgi:hypothetical protein